MKERTALRIAVTAWAVLVAALLAAGPRSTTEESNLPAPPENAPEAQETAIAEEATVAEMETVEEDELDLDKLPQIVNATLTHYCICEKCCGKTQEHPAYGITASGREAEPYVSVAVDPFMIELGSKVYVDYGDGEIHEYRADDMGGSITGAKIDLCVSSHEEALELGIKTVKVWWDE